MTAKSMEKDRLSQCETSSQFLRLMYPVHYVTTCLSLASSNIIRILVSKIGENELMTSEHSMSSRFSVLFDQKTALGPKVATSV